jgi:hypothetical protein
MKESAVELLWQWITKNPDGSFKDASKVYLEAKEIEKDNIIDAYNDGSIFGADAYEPYTGDEYYFNSYTQFE